MSTKVALAFGILTVVGVLARIAGSFAGQTFVGRDLVIFGPALAILGVVGVVISLLVGAVKRSANNPPTTPAGWYPDPHDATVLRYFDGGTWTQHTTPRQTGP